MKKDLRIETLDFSVLSKKSPICAFLNIGSSLFLKVAHHLPNFTVGFFVGNRHYYDTMYFPHYLKK
jgi:hypothetical protein